MAPERAEFKKGDKIIVTESYGGAPEGVVLEVLRRSNGCYVVRPENDNTNRQYNVYYNRFGAQASCDVVVPADRKVRSEYLKKKVEELNEEVKKHERDIEILDNFDSEEDYVAHKLGIIFASKDDPKAMAKALKELRNSHIL